MKEAFRIGITGGIASGKSTISRVFRSLGIPVFNSDIVSKRILETDLQAKEAVIMGFGSQVYFPSGELDRAALGKIVFSDQEKLKMLESIAHPAVERAFEHWCNSHTRTPYLLKEAAILFEKGSYLKLDKTILVTARERTRIARATQRDGVSEEMVRERLAHQWPEEKKKSLADYVISNDEESEVLTQTLGIHSQLLAIAAQSTTRV